jgi:hypothetical protein
VSGREDNNRMTEAQWLSCSRPRRLFSFVAEKASERQKRCLALAWFRAEMEREEDCPPGLVDQAEQADLVLGLAEWWNDRPARCVHTSGLVPFFQSWIRLHATRPDFASLCDEILFLPGTDYRHWAAAANHPREVQEVVLLMHLWKVYRGEAPRSYEAYFFQLVSELDKFQDKVEPVEPTIRRIARQAEDLLPLLDLTYCCALCGWNGPPGTSGWERLYFALAGRARIGAS